MKYANPLRLSWPARVRWMKIEEEHKIEEVVEIEVNCKIEEEVIGKRGARFARTQEI